ncbi:hypothetical protein FQN54_000123 [Arachnomyces sp. PD_36]|nr:hypothetical protein FQN54_000123 [Arachnomyces sp. PD_36]
MPVESLTETSVAAALTSFYEIRDGSFESLLPDYQARISRPNGEDITAYDEVGEVLLKSDNLFIGYLGDGEDTKITFDADGWMRTGDFGMVRVMPSGTEHLFIVDRIKDMIKVKAFELSFRPDHTVLFNHPAIIETAVVGVLDEAAGERSMGFVVRCPTEMADMREEDL